MNDVLLNSFVLAGGQYYDLKHVIEEIEIDDKLSLIAELENEHDEYAVQVYWDKHMLGYLSRSQNRIIHNMLINDLKLYGQVTQINKNFSTRLEFDIYLQL